MILLKDENRDAGAVGSRISVFHVFVRKPYVFAVPSSVLQVFLEEVQGIFVHDAFGLFFGKTVFPEKSVQRSSFKRRIQAFRQQSTVIVRTECQVFLRAELEEMLHVAQQVFLCEQTARAFECVAVKGFFAMPKRSSKP